MLLIFLVPLFPIVQDQWLNIFLLNEFEFSFYSILYYISGFLFPIIIINNSLSNFFDYKFNPNKYQSKKIKYIGYLVLSTILLLSILIIRYLTFLSNYIIFQLDLNNYFDIKLRILLSFIVVLLLLINKTKRVLKKLYLLIFFIICSINWSNYFLNLQGIDNFINKFISNESFYEFNNLNILNIFYLLIFELLYYLWSFISYQNNLSDWSIKYSKRVDLIPISKITIFYFGIFIYYLIFKRIS